MLEILTVAVDQEHHQLLTFGEDALHEFHQFVGHFGLIDQTPMPPPPSLSTMRWWEMVCPTSVSDAAIVPQY
jgi:hypothetical protein